MKLYKIQWKVRRGQEISLESSKGSIGAASRILPLSRIHTRIHEIPWNHTDHEHLWTAWKYMQVREICEMRWKSSKDKKPAWNGAKVSRGAAGRILPFPKIHTRNESKSVQSTNIYENHERRQKSVELFGIRWKSSKDKKPAWNPANLYKQQAVVPFSKIHTRNTSESMKIHNNICNHEKSK